MALTIMGIFSYYAVAAQNQGFAILWIAIVPAVAMLLLNFRLGFIVSTYFLLFLIVVFYTPLKGILQENIFTERSPGIFEQAFKIYYNETFVIRFPLLYACGFVTSLFLTAQKQYYSNQSDKNALYDALTELGNRRFYNDYVDSLTGKPVDRNLAIVSVDMNCLKTLNDNLGHDYGDRAIIDTAKLLVDVFGSYTEDIYRTGGDEFVVFFIDRNNELNSLLEKIETKEKEYKCEDVVLSVSYGAVKGIDYIDADISKLITIAESNMYRYKDNYYKSNNLDRRHDNRIKF